MASCTHVPTYKAKLCGKLPEVHMRINSYIILGDISLLEHLYSLYYINYIACRSIETEH